MFLTFKQGVAFVYAYAVLLQLVQQLKEDQAKSCSQVMSVSKFVAQLPTKTTEIILVSYEDRIASGFKGHQFKMKKLPGIY